MTRVEFFVDPSCPWAWITAEWVREVAPQRDLDVVWRSYCLEIRDDYDVAPTMAPEWREAALAGHALSHRMLRIFEAVRAEAGDGPIDGLYSAWGRRFFVDRQHGDDDLIRDCLADCGLDAALLGAADDPKWDEPILEAMEVAYAYGGPKTQTPTLVVGASGEGEGDGDGDHGRHGFKGPVMSPAPTGADALTLWDAVMVLSQHDGFFEITRPRNRRPQPGRH
jgi:2-hydroxychromene-2-carboxylate isomerase